MTRQAAAKARQNFSEIISQVAYGKDRVVIERNGKGLAAVIPMEDLKILQEMEDRADREDVRKVKQEIKKHGTISWADYKKKKRKKTKAAS